MAIEVGHNVVTPLDVSPSAVMATGSTTSRSLANRFADVVNVKDFGAKGDGATDDTAAIQAAIAAAAGGPISFHGGDFKIATPVGSNGLSGTIIQGAGQLRTRILNYGAGPAIQTPLSAGLRGFEVRDLSIIGMAAGSTHGVEIQNDFGAIRLSNLRISWQGSVATRYGVTVGALTTGGIDIGLDGVRVDGATTGFLCSVFPVNTWTAVNCYASGCTAQGWQVTYPGSVTLIGCMADSCGGSGFYIGGGGGNHHLIGCSAEANTVAGFAHVGAGTPTLVGCITAGQVAPFLVSVAGANPTLINFQTSGTPSGTSIVAAGYANVRIMLVQADMAQLDAGLDAAAASATRVFRSNNATSADRGDTSQTLTVGADAPIQRWATALGQNRTVTLSTTGAVNGDSFHIVRTGLGAFTLDVGPGLKTIPNATAAFVDVTYDGAAWFLDRYGTL